jgi:gluconate 2-dehydrogenase gamma chain
MNTDIPGRPQRRQFLLGSGAVAVAPLILNATASGADAADVAGVHAKQPAGYQSLGPEEAAIVEKIVDVMCPADALTAGGVELGLAIYIDRQLAGAFGRGDRLYRHGPWRPGRPELGYQSALTPERFFKIALTEMQAAALVSHGKPFTDLSASQADAFLLEVSSGRISSESVRLATWFNEMLYPLFAQACFVDPIYGGNRGKAFWKAIGYPGLPAFNTRNVVEFRGKPYPAAAQPKSMQDFS